MNADQRDQILADILNLSVACSHAECKQQFCPLHDVRKMPPAQRIDWCNMLVGEDLDYFIHIIKPACIGWNWLPFAEEFTPPSFYKSTTASGNGLAAESGSANARELLAGKHIYNARAAGTRFH